MELTMRHHWWLSRTLLLTRLPILDRLALFGPTSGLALMLSSFQLLFQSARIKRAMYAAEIMASMKKLFPLLERYSGLLSAGDSLHSALTYCRRKGGPSNLSERALAYLSSLSKRPHTKAVSCTDFATCIIKLRTISYLSVAGEEPFLVRILGSLVFVVYMSSSSSCSAIASTKSSEAKLPFRSLLFSWPGSILKAVIVAWASCIKSFLEGLDSQNTI